MEAVYARYGNEPVRVAYQGEPGAFSEEAVQALLGERAVPVPCPEFSLVGEVLRDGQAQLAVLPLENSIHGGVTGVYDVLASGELVVLAQTVLPIRLCLAVLPGARQERIRRILSHPVALAQCQRFLRSLEGVEAVAIHDTAGAAREVAERGDPGIAAVASRAAADRYGLEVMEADVQDRGDNQTRFLLVGPATGDNVAPALPAPGQRLMLLIDLAHRPGALVAVLAPFAARRINLASIQSRPAGEPWSYRFFIEVVGPEDPAALAGALVDVRDAAHHVAVLGCY